MPKSAPLAQPADLAVACALLTRLPMRLPPDAYTRGARSAWAWPLVGLLVGGAAGFVALVALALGLPHTVSALLALCVMIASTGAMHEDGLADTADGFWGASARSRRLEIMRDSRIGAYGVIALFLSLALRGAALAALGDALVPALIAAAMLSRAAMAHVMDALPNARPDGLSMANGRPGQPAMRLAALIALGAALLVAGWAGLWAFAAALAASLACARIALAKIGGQTGDVLGATQQVTEIASLLALSAAL